MRGRDKLLEEVDGVPLLRRQAKVACEVGQSVLVLLPPDAGPRRDVLEGLRVRIATVDRAAEGISASIAVATRYAGGTDGLAILLPDVPGVGSSEIRRVLDTYSMQRPTRTSDDSKSERFQEVLQPVRATDPEGRPGTPIVLPPRLYPALERLSGDAGARHILRHEAVLDVPFADDRATRDLDTPEEWDAWRRERAIVRGN